MADGNRDTQTAEEIDDRLGESMHAVRDLILNGPLERFSTDPELHYEASDLLNVLANALGRTVR